MFILFPSLWCVARIPKVKLVSIDSKKSASRLESHDLCPGEAITERDVCGVGIGRWFKRPREFTLRQQQPLALPASVAD